MKARAESDDFDIKGADDKRIVLSYMVHLADISNPTKVWPLVLRWTDHLFIEFFN